MGREATITYEQIAAVADAMKVEGLKPTSRAVRERAGGTGSMGTINKLLGRWKAGQERQISAALVLPPALQRVLLEFMDNELTATRMLLEAELAEQLQEASDMAEENERQALESQEQTEAIELLRSEVASHKGRTSQLEADLAASRDEVARERSAAEQARTELAKAQLRLEAMPRLEADLEAVRAVLETQRTARQQAEQAAAVLAAKLEAAERRASEAEARTNKAEMQAETSARELLSANATVQAGQARLEGAAREIADVKQALVAASAAVKKSGEDAAALQGQLNALSEKTTRRAKAAKSTENKIVSDNERATKNRLI